MVYAFAPEKTPSLVGRNFCLAIPWLFLESLGVVIPAACDVDKINYPSDTPLLAADHSLFLECLRVHQL
jgi:hypothetical protein